MPLDATGDWTMDQVVPAREILDRIDSVFPLIRSLSAGGDTPPAGDRSLGELASLAASGTEPAERFAYADGIGDVGVIASVTEPFCGDCDRVRVTAEGKFRTCLFGLDETDLRSVLRGGGSDADLAAAIEGAVAQKWAGHSIGSVEFIRPARSMSQIGG